VLSVEDPGGVPNSAPQAASAFINCLPTSSLGGPQLVGFGKQRLAPADKHGVAMFNHAASVCGPKVPRVTQRRG
jgi:hypothetical protein